MAILKKWNKLYPPDKRELNRNSRIEAVQGNRNPLIDNHSLVDTIF